ncbi:MAG: rhomboid family intramembrane serine protease [Cyanobacteria bacterium P01_H01_bin.121]
MVPLNDNNPTRNRPVIVYALIAINVLVFFHQYQLQLADQRLPVLAQQAGFSYMSEFFQSWAVIPRELNDNLGREWITLISSQFLHGGVLHLAGNMLYLWVFGNNIEDKLGRVRFVLFYIGCGMLAALTQSFFSPANSPIPIIGASGAIAGVMGAYIIRFPKAEILTILPILFYVTAIRIPAVYFLGIWFVQQAIFSFLSLGGPSNVSEGGVAYWAHAAGFVFGIILAPPLGLFDDDYQRR